MDLLNMLMTAKVLDTDGAEIGDVLAIRIMNGHLVITVLTEEEDEGDDDGGEEVTPEESVGLTLVQPIKQAAKGGGSNG